MLLASIGGVSVSELIMYFLVIVAVSLAVLAAIWILKSPGKW